MAASGNWGGPFEGVQGSFQGDGVDINSGLELISISCDCCVLSTREVFLSFGLDAQPFKPGVTSFLTMLCQPVTSP